MKTRHYVAVSTMALLAFAAAPAAAQEATAPVPQEEEFESAGDIIVTATRREQSIQEIPIAVTAVPQSLLQNAGVQDIRGLEQLAPSIQSSTGQSSATGTTLFIRGITTAGDNPGFEPAVGVFIDGVYRARAGVAVSELPQLERVEVLRGPQGTLFGRNTSAGALSIFTAKPSFDLGGYAQATYGNYNQIELEGAVTGPISETIALRIDGGYRKRDGYIEDVNSDRSINDINRYYVRGQALFETTDVTFRLIGDYYETDENCCGAVSAARVGGAANPTPLIDAIAGAQGLDGVYTGDPSERRMAVSPNRAFTEKVRDYGVSGELNWDLGGVSLTSITAYRQWRALRDQDIDFSGIDRAYREDYLNELGTITQELRLQGSAFDGGLDWLVGGFYLNETNKLRDTVRVGNDANRYVDSIFANGLRASFGTPLQFYGSLPGTPLLGQALLGTPTGNFPAALQPLVTLFKGQAGVQAVPGVTPIPGLLALATSPLPAAVAGQGNNNDDFRVKTNAVALFTHNIINFTDKLSLTLGARWNYEKKELDATINSNTGSCGFFNQVRSGNAAANAYAFVLRQLGVYNNLFLLSCNPALNSEFNGTYSDDFSDSQITGTAKLAYKINDDVLLYGGYDRGFKSGGYNMDQATFDSVQLGGNGAQASDLQFDGETVDAYEIGLKTSPLRGLTFNIAGFYSKFNNLQSLVFSGNNFVVQNVDSTTSKGVEVETTIQPDRNLLIRWGYSYIDAKYDESNDFAGTPLQGQEGLQLLNQPKHTVTIATTWTPEIGNGVHALVHADMRYNSEVNLNSTAPNPVTGETALRNQGYPLINARLGIQNSDGSRGLEFFVENLTNEFYYITSFPVPEQTGNIAGYPGLPRFYGIQARFGF
ncbi:TonB-dependent receptor [Sphingomonas sp. BGYR3]|uniref:TonB-dependent receptor n=1 Tax=Sphingomonas sp. BGYR3 TaxID=2975483 RepID=UPI0021A86F48|nr:TonB-dependent receptor [Sphingomonas sp. BGYR3]MDG5487606.1 TonB-dependent receptor [Sphingomonas sp. BGYR3]